jgi:mannose-1-phosphate guanylyltransferase
MILAGGVGSRFYPLSREDKPKQFLSLFSNQPMIADTWDRVIPIVGEEDIYVVTNAAFRQSLFAALPVCRPNNCIFEPAGRNTAPAIGLACLKIMQDGGDAVVMSLHSDHFIRKEARFLSILKDAAEIVAEQDKIITIGITPDYPETGYGYIEAGEEEPGQKNRFQHYKVNFFKEKPDFITAQSYVRAGSFFWNAGIFVFRASFMLEQMRHYCPALYNGLQKLAPLLTPEMQDSEEFISAFRELDSIPIDIAVMEKSDHIYVIPADIGWSDVGSFQSLYQLREKTTDGNVFVGKNQELLQAVDAKNNLIVQEIAGKKVGVLGVRNLMIVDTADYLLIGDLSESQEVRIFSP